MLVEMKRLIVAVLFLSLSEVTYAQDNILLIQLVPTTLNTKVSTSELELLATKISGRNIISGIVSDGSGIVIIETNERTTSLKLDPFKVIISPLTVHTMYWKKSFKKNNPSLEHSSSTTPTSLNLMCNKCQYSNTRTTII